MTTTPGSATVLVVAPLPDKMLEPLTNAGISTVTVPDPTDAAFEAGLAEASGLIIGTNLTIDATLMDRAPNLKAISTVSVGLDHIDLHAASARGIAVATTPVLSDAVAELTLGLMLAVARRLVVSARNVTTGDWSKQVMGTSLRDKTLFVIGFGRIGQEVARRAASFKMNVIYYDARDVPPQPGVTAVATIEEGLPLADFVSVHVDLNPTTAHLIDQAALATMKPTAILINTSRGGVVDQQALAEALAQKRLGGAGLDVLEHEPPADDEPLLQMDNVVVVPHIGSATRETRKDMFDTALDNMRLCILGLPCQYVVPCPPDAGIE